MYALIENNEISQTWDDKPVNVNGVGFQTDAAGRATSPDEVYAEYSVYPISIEPMVKDQYTNAQLNFSVVDGLPVGIYAYAPKPTEEVRAIKIAELTQEWQRRIQQGSFTSQIVPDFVVDCRRNQIDNDVQNIDGVLSLASLGAIAEPILWKGKTNFAALTVAQLQGLRAEMLGYAASVYQRKFETIAACAGAETIENILMVNF